MTSKLSGELSSGMVTTSSPSMALDGKNAMESVASRYIGTIEKQGAETTTFRFKPNFENQSSMEPLKFGLDGEAMMVGYSATSANDGFLPEIDDVDEVTQTWCSSNSFNTR